ncbi:hypothetical protein HOH51_03335 [bacterium]|jgi:hypothetical protein|nr:hypothetical protein [bacterium]
MTKIIKLFIFTALFLGLSQSVFAQDFSVLPKTTKGKIDCLNTLKTFDTEYQALPVTGTSGSAYNSYARFDKARTKVNPTPTEKDIMGCSIKTGKIRLYMWKPFVVYLIKNLSVLAGVLSMLFIVLGGYQYFLAMVQGEDTKAKATIKNAIFGLIIALCSWMIVDLVQTLVSY